MITVVPSRGEPDPGPPPPGLGSDDASLLDAYSRAVVDVFERAGPAVVAIEIGAARGSHPGRVRRAWLGVGAIRRPLDRRLAYHHDLGAAAVEVQSIEPGSPAARARLEEGDLLVRFGTIALDGVDALHRALRTWPAGQPAELVVIRRGMRITVEITPAWSTSR